MAYTRVNWENLPSTNTPVNATNLNKMENGIANAVEKTGDTMTGALLMQGNTIGFGSGGNIFFKEDGYGDKFRIIPDFGNAGANNKLIIQSTTGDAGTDPTNWQDLVYIHADTGYIELAGNIGSKSQIDYSNWHSIVLTRSDNSLLYITLYGSNLLKEGTYSIVNDFRILTYGTTNSDLTIPKSAITQILRQDWGFELVINRSGISGISSGNYNGIAVVASGITLQST